MNNTEKSVEEETTEGEKKDSSSAVQSTEPSDSGMAAASAMDGVAATALRSVIQRIEHVAERCGRRSDQVRLVAVSKTKPVSLVKQVYDAGHRCFGENYVKELVEKAPQLPDDIEWHFIGNLQSNKVKPLLTGVPNLAMVETVDDEKVGFIWNSSCAEEAMALPSAFRERFEQMEQTRNEHLSFLQSEKELQHSKSQLLASRFSNITSIEKRCLKLDRKIASHYFIVSFLESRFHQLDADYLQNLQKYRDLKDEGEDLEETEKEKQS